MYAIRQNGMFLMGFYYKYVPDELIPQWSTTRMFLYHTREEAEESQKKIENETSIVRVTVEVV